MRGRDLPHVCSLAETGRHTPHWRMRWILIERGQSDTSGSARKRTSATRGNEEKNTRGRHASGKRNTTATRTNGTGRSGNVSPHVADVSCIHIDRACQHGGSHNVGSVSTSLVGRNPRQVALGTGARVPECGPTSGARADCRPDHLLDCRLGITDNGGRHARRWSTGVLRAKNLASVPPRSG